MLGLMQQHPLLISSIIVHAARHHGDGEVVSRRPSGALVRTTYRDIDLRARKVAAGLAMLGTRRGERVGTIAMNSDRHLELYYGISGAGMVCNTINPRLSPDDIAYIATHAEDGILFIDPAFLPSVAAIAAKLPALRAVVVLCDAASIPQADQPVSLLCYEELLAQATPISAWPQFDENTASGLCYTSGTTGRPKNVLYSHRASLLHAMVSSWADTENTRATDRVLLAVPMFHVNAWGVPFGGPMAGASLLMPGAQLDAASLLELMNSERATSALGVPTVWLNQLNLLRDTGGKIETLKRVLIGGAAMPRALLEAYQQMGIRRQAGLGLFTV